jgi:hypothetical protein
MAEIRIVEYCGNTYTMGWEKIYAIQPVQAFGNSAYTEDEIDDFLEVLEIELSDFLEALDLDGDIIREFSDRLQSMIEGQNAIGVLTIERRLKK